MHSKGYMKPPPVRNPRLLVLTLLLILISAAGSFSPSAVANATDRAALLAFKILVSDDPSGALASWNVSLHHCRWRGVTCGSRLRHPERVISLDLDNLNLTGSISPHLANLTFLRNLSLPYNHFHGRIPPELGDGLRHLRYLNLRFNSLGGEIPPSLSHCSRLRYLTLKSNMLTGPIPANFSGWQELQHIGLGYNGLTGGIPSALGSLPNLLIVDMFNNSLTGPLPPSLGNLSSLIGIDVERNGVSGSIPENLRWLRALTIFAIADNALSGDIPRPLFNLSSLTTFSVGGNQLSGTFPPDMGLTLPNLQFIQAFYNEFLGPIPASLPNASSLEQIVLHGNGFNGRVPPNLGSLQSLSSVSVGRNQLEASKAADWDFLRSLTNCTVLSTLDLTDNELGGTLPDALANLSTQLSWLGLGQNHISGTIPEEIGRYVNLTNLRMDNNLLTGRLPVSLGMLHKLHELELQGNHISGEIPPSISNLTQLNILDLSLNGLRGGVPPSFGDLQVLEVLDLSYNQLNGSIPTELVHGLSGLSQYLNLSHNSLSGPLPDQIGVMKNLQTFDVSENMLSGEIPIGLGDMEILEYLFIEGNLFNGSILPSLGNLQGLIELDLSGNNLSGTIPKSLENLRDLQRLNLSFNDLEGPVPEEGPFANASIVSVLHNKKLCGGIPELSLQPCRIGAPAKKLASSLRFRLIITTASVVAFILLMLLIAFVYNKVLIKSRRRNALTGASSPNHGHVKISYSELFRATEGFSPANLIGAGSFGSVYRGVLHVDYDPQIVAIKVFELHRQGASKSFHAECEALRNVRHRNVIKIMTSCSSIDNRGDEFLALVFEFMPNGSLDEWLHTNYTRGPRNLSLVQRLNIAIDVASAVDYLHRHHGSEPIVHGDLKPSNVLLDHHMRGHVSDFGLARLRRETVTDSSQQEASSSIRLLGSIGYIAPEHAMGSQVSTQGDVYSYGILLLEMFTGKRPTDDTLKDGQNLHNFVSIAYPQQAMDVIDTSLLLEGEGDACEKVRDCLISIIRIGLLCSKESPKERIEMGDVIEEMLVISNNLLGRGVDG